MAEPCTIRGGSVALCSKMSDLCSSKKPTCSYAFENRTTYHANSRGPGSPAYVHPATVPHNDQQNDFSKDTHSKQHALTFLLQVLPLQRSLRSDLDSHASCAAAESTARGITPLRGYIENLCERVGKDTYKTCSAGTRIDPL